jgi:hypothetical protein
MAGTLLSLVVVKVGVCYEDYMATELLTTVDDQLFRYRTSTGYLTEVLLYAKV